MKRFTLFASLCLAAGGSLVAQNVSVKAKNRPAATVFAEIMRQTDKNFIYSSSLLKGVKVSITAKTNLFRQCWTACSTAQVSPTAYAATI